MNKDLKAYIERYFSGIVVRHTEKLLNDEGDKYLHKKMLKKQFSLSGKWDNLISLNGRVMADIVALDSTIPLKSRPSLQKVTGDIVKIAMKRRLTETDMVNLNALIATGRSEAEVLAELFKDVPAVVNGIYERLEATFLQGLSSGVASIDDANNVGTSIRIDYGYLDGNKFKATKKWDGAGYKPLTDLRQMLDRAEANGHTIKHLYMDRATFNRFAESEEVRSYVAGVIGIAVAGKQTPTPTLARINEAFAGDASLGFAITLVNRSVRVERDGVQRVIKPWEAGMIIALTDQEVGKLVWADSAEAVYPVAGKRYEKADDFLLVSQWRSEEPLSEHTASQARAIPVICNVESIYQLNTLQTAGESVASSGSESVASGGSYGVPL